MRMGRRIAATLKRTAIHAGPTVLGIIVLDFLFLQLMPGDVADVMAIVPGVANLKVEPNVMVPRVTIRIRPDAAERFGTPLYGRIYDQTHSYDTVFIINIVLWLVIAAIWLVLPKYRYSKNIGEMPA